MPGWPTDDLTTTNLDSATDDPSLARAELLAAVQKIQAILAEVAPGATILTAATAASTYAPKAGDNTQKFKAANGTASDDVVTLAQLSGATPAASTSAAGLVELATSTEFNVGTDAGRVPAVATLRGGIIVTGSPLAMSGLTSRTISGIPAWAKRVKILLNGVSITGSDNLLLQIGDSGGIETTGYSGGYGVAGAVIGAALSTAFVVSGAQASALISGAITLDLSDASGHEYIASSVVGRSDGYATMCGGAKALTSELTQVRLLLSGANTFDAGTVTVIYE